MAPPTKIVDRGRALGATRVRRRVRRRRLLPDFAVKAAVLVVRLAKNHALPDGSKRAAWVSLRMFVEPNGWSWHTPPSVDETERAVLAIASGDWNEQDMTATRLYLNLRVPTCTARS